MNNEVKVRIQQFFKTHLVLFLLLLPFAAILYFGIFKLQYAATIPHTYQFNPSDDVFVKDGDYASLNFNKNSFLRTGEVSSTCSGTNCARKNIYLKFNVDRVVGDVKSVKLRMFVRDPSGSAGTLYAVNDSSWTEQSLTWNNAPVAVNVPLSSPGKASNKSWVEFFIPATLMPSNGVYSFKISTTNTNMVSYDSKEAYYKPVLIVDSAEVIVPTATPTPVPIPTLTPTPTPLPPPPPTSTPVPTSIPTSAPTPTSAPVGGLPGYTLLWADEFNGSVIDSTKWNVVTGTLSYDRGCYVAGNVAIVGGSLVVTTKYQPNICDSLRPFTTGYVRTTSPTKFVISPTNAASKIVRLEFRAQLPYIKGLWPALWSRNQFSSKTIGATDPYGELDLMERYGDETNNMTYASTSWLGGKSNDGKTGYVTNRKCPIPTGDTTLQNNCGNITTSMHDYALEIDTSKVKPEVRYFLDNRLITVHNQDTQRNDSTFPFNAADWLKSLNNNWDLRIMTQVVKEGDAYHTAPTITGYVTQELKVDYVRVYKKN